MVSLRKKKSASPEAGAVMGRLIIFTSILMKAMRNPLPEKMTEVKDKVTAQEWEQLLGKLRKEDAEQFQLLKRNGLWKGMTKKERSFLMADPLKVMAQEFIDVQWLTDSVGCLLWALGYIPELPPYDTEIDTEPLIKLPEESIENLIKKATLRPREEIEKQRDIAEGWLSRSLIRSQQESEPGFTFPGFKTMDELLQKRSAVAAAKGEIPAPIEGDFPAFGKAYRDLTQEEFSQATIIAVERHHALDWLCGLAPGNRWDDA